MRSCMDACTHVRMHACTHARMPARTHARMHVRTHEGTKVPKMAQVLKLPRDVAAQLSKTMRIQVASVCHYFSGAVS